MDLFSLNEEEWNRNNPVDGLAPFRVRQLFHWFHHRGVWDYDQMDNLPLALREKLKKEYPVDSLNILQWIPSQEDETKKILFELSDHNIVEGVLLSYRHGNSLCLSTQVGCAMGCRFCASTLGGKVRNVLRREMLQMFYLTQQRAEKRISHVVLMGSGEPLDNLEEVKGFLEILTDPEGQNVSWRNITLSTCGLIPGIEVLAQWNRPLTLAISLHSAREEVRRDLMPVSKRYPVKDVVDAALKYQKETGRRVSFEVSLIKGVNDTDEDIHALTKLLTGSGAHVNLIGLNPIEERELTSASEDRLQTFKKSLEAKGIRATIRREMGRDVQGACGQLRSSVLAKKMEKEKIW